MVKGVRSAYLWEVLILAGGMRESLGYLDLVGGVHICIPEFYI